MFLMILATVFGVIMGASHFSQAYRIYTRKSAKDLSLITYSLLFMGALVWFLYGITILNYAVIVSNFVGLVATISVLFGWVKYH
ncbi:hypothetical protein K9L97_05535 [Candidatus Woesearchaeota archaeon]|nr:hypothetical protein [Candidatus Woesearchaeota archaeon]